MQESYRCAVPPTSLVPVVLFTSNYGSTYLKNFLIYSLYDKTIGVYFGLFDVVSGH